jgi:arginase
VKEILVNGQWQGGADPVTLDGAKEITKLYLTGLDYVILPVSTDISDMEVRKNGILGFNALHRQMQSAYERLREDAPDKVFAVGGGCDADVPVIVYLSEMYQSDFTVIWLDAHGDLNTPGESASSLYYGMPLRSVMDDQCFGLLGNRYPLSISQVIHIGGRDFDEAESAFIKEAGMAAYSVQNIRSDSDLIHRIIEGIHSEHIYVHLDLDVIDPREFPNTPLPVDNGLSGKEVYDILTSVSDRLAGMGIYEYAPLGAGNALIEKLIQFGTAL